MYFAFEIRATPDRKINNNICLVACILYSLENWLDTTARDRLNIFLQIDFNVTKRNNSLQNRTYKTSISAIKIWIISIVFKLVCFLNCWVVHRFRFLKKWPNNNCNQCTHTSHEHNWNDARNVMYCKCCYSSHISFFMWVVQNKPKVMFFYEWRLTDFFHESVLLLTMNFAIT